MPGKGAVGGVEQMMAFVEDQPAHGAGLLLLFICLGGPSDLVDGSLAQHQGMIGDDDVGLAGGARRSLDEAFAVMRAGGIDAFAAPVGEAERAGEAVAGIAGDIAGQAHEPGGEIAADHVAVAARQRPARDELGEERGAPANAAMRPNASCMLSRQT